jgi:hypothetical protein
MRLRALVPKLVAQALVEFGMVLPQEREQLIERLALEAALELPLARHPGRAKGRQ